MVWGFKTSIEIEDGIYRKKNILKILSNHNWKTIDDLLVTCSYFLTT